MKTETIVLNEKRDVSLTVYLHDEDERNRPAVIVIPGGGYQFCSPAEADPVAFSYLSAGYNAFVLRYTVGKNMVWPEPLEDYEMAMKMIRDRAEEWQVYADKIAVVGFSSGGHLAAAAATMAENRPNAAVLCYAVLGDIVKLRNQTAPETIGAVDENTPPCFVFQSRTDGNVPVINSIKFMEALSKYNIVFEGHIYSYGQHGCSTLVDVPAGGNELFCGRIKNWVSDSVTWLQEIFGMLTADGMTEPRNQ